MKKGLAALILIICLIRPTLAAQVIIPKPEVYLKNGFLMAEIEIQTILGKKEIKTLQSGLTTTIFIKAQLWEKGKLIDRLKAVRILKREVCFDIWEKTYTLLKTERPKPIQIKEYNQLEQALSEKEVVSLLPISALSASQSYFVRLYVGVESINKREIGQIKRWVDSSGGLINVGQILGFLVKRGNKADENHIRTDYFSLSSLSRRE